LARRQSPLRRTRRSRLPGTEHAEGLEPGPRGLPGDRRTKGDVVAYYERIASRALPHVVGRPLSIRATQRGSRARKFFQKNVPDHYPESIERFRRAEESSGIEKHPSKGGKDQDFTVLPVVRQPEHLAYLANQGAIELHRTDCRAAADLFHPGRLVIDLDPPPGPFACRSARGVHRPRCRPPSTGWRACPVATGSKATTSYRRSALGFSSETIAVTLFRNSLLSSRPSTEKSSPSCSALRYGEDASSSIWLRNSPIGDRDRALLRFVATTARNGGDAAYLDRDPRPTDPDAFSIATWIASRPARSARRPRHAPSDTERIVACRRRGVRGIGASSSRHSIASAPDVSAESPAIATSTRCPRRSGALSTSGNLWRARHEFRGSPRVFRLQLPRPTTSSGIRKRGRGTTSQGVLRCSAPPRPLRAAPASRNSSTSASTAVRRRSATVTKRAPRSPSRLLRVMAEPHAVDGEDDPRRWTTARSRSAPACAAEALAQRAAVRARD